MIAGTYDWLLVAMSVLIAMVASFTALDLAARVRASTGSARLAWLSTAALAMGGGIWAMHFVAMLAFSMADVPVQYDLALTLLSFVIPIAVTGISFAVMSRGKASVPVLVAAGAFMGLGVVAMHYCGMAAMHMSASLRYERLWVAISVFVAVGAATVALWLSMTTGSGRQRFAAAGVMGLAISGMHFAGMKAAVFTMLDTADDPARAAGLSNTALALDVSAAALLILFLALIAAMFDRRFAQMAAREAAALRLSEDRFRTLYRGTPLPLHSLDADGRIEQVSDTWLQLLGYERDEVIGRPLEDFLDGSSAAQARGSDGARLLREGVLVDRDWRMVTKSGELRDVVASARIQSASDGSFRRILGGLTDVTARKRAEEALRQAQKIEAIGQLTGGIAHDFNNLLAVVIGNLDLLSRRVDEGSREQRLVASAMDGARRGATLTQRLLAFARRQDLRPASVDVPALVQGLFDMLERTLGPQVHVATRFPPRLPAALADAHQLELAILNMAVNARDAMPDGGTLTLSATDEVIRQEGAEDGGVAAGHYIRLDVTDTGIGMDAATVARAGEPFFTTKGVGRGTGLGLSMVHGLAAQSGGVMRIQSTLGKGTTIGLWLPIAKVAPPVGGMARPAILPDLPALSILVVDDDDLVLRNTAAMLEDLGHLVVTADSGVRALRRLDGLTHFDLLVTDQLMPGMTGVQLAGHAASRKPPLPVLLVTGFAELTPEESGRFDVLYKPFEQLALAQAVARIYARTKVVA